MSEQTLDKKNIEENKMREIEIERLVLSCAGIKEKLEKQEKLLKKISKKKPSLRKTNKRIPGFGIRPKLEVGCMVTLRGNEAFEMLKKLLGGVDNEIRKKQIADNHFSFGIKEYIEIPGEEYDREIGMMGFSITVVFSRKGRRIIRRKAKKGTLPKKQVITKEEIINFMEENFDTEII